MPFKPAKLEVWQLALDYVDLIYKIGNQLPKSEEYNLKSQMIRAATSVALNIAAGSTGQTDAEQARGHFILAANIPNVVTLSLSQRDGSRNKISIDDDN